MAGDSSNRPAIGNVLVTGASGWVGRALLAGAASRDIRAIPLSARDPAAMDFGQQVGEPGNLEPISLVHLAAIAHRTGQDAPLDYRRVNCELAVDVATRARDAGVRRFVFVSSARVMGETHATRWRPDDVPQPVGPYAQAKWSAECALRELAQRSPVPFEIAIVRPPLIYGPGVPANFRRLLQLVDSGVPIPMVADAGPRSYLYLANAVDALLFIATRGEPTDETYFVRDDREWATPELLAALRERMHRPLRRLSLPAALVRGAGALAGRRALLDRLLGTATIDDARLRALGWRAPVSPDEALDRTVAWFRSGTAHPAKGPR